MAKYPSRQTLRIRCQPPLGTAGASPAASLQPGQHQPQQTELLCAPLHMYSIASWSPSQSLPLMVSYACHRQSSSAAAGRRTLKRFCGAQLPCQVWLATNHQRLASSSGYERLASSGSAPPRPQQRPTGQHCRCWRRTRHVAQRGIDAALCRHGVAAGGEQLGDAPATVQGVVGSAEVLDAAATHAAEAAQTSGANGRRRPCPPPLTLC